MNEEHMNLQGPVATDELLSLKNAAPRSQCFSTQMNIQHP